MSWASSEIVNVLTFLLPGFVAATIFYSLTSHPQPGAFDRVIQALIFTVIGQAIIASFATLTDAQWIQDWELPLSISVAIVLALVTVYISNNDTLHYAFRRLGITKETSYPSEWYSSFSRHHGCYIVLHLKGERRLCGWPQEWPSCPDQGHFRIAEGKWLVGDRQIPATGVSAILISVSEVDMVEFLDPHFEESEE